MSRPITSFEEVIGHKSIMRFIVKRVEQDNVPNFIILHGNAGTGKTAVAKLIACHIVNAKYGSDRLNKSISDVIINNHDTDNIKLFNMSNLRDNSEIQQVKAELNTGFSSTKRKVIILDEAHGMTPEAQDAILTAVEPLPKDVWVILCTTELGALRDALQSRAKAVWAFNALSENEAKSLISKEIMSRGLRFDVPVEFISQIIAVWSQNEPRRALNLIESFDCGAVVTSQDIAAFIETGNVSVIMQLIKYLYGSMVLGISYVQDIKLDNMFVHGLIEVLKVALGSQSSEVTRQQQEFIQQFFKENNVDNYMRFSVKVSGMDILVRRKVIAAFIEEHVDFQNVVTAKTFSTDEIVGQNMASLNENIIQADMPKSSKSVAAKTLSEMFQQSERVE